MPVYDIKCLQCGFKFELAISFKDSISNWKCGKCGSSKLEKQYNKKSPAVIYKTKGFYNTDK